MQMQRSLQHDGDELRFILTGPRGPIELRVTLQWAALCHNGEAECLPGDEIATLWRASDHDDNVIWHELERRYDAYTRPAANPGDQPTGPLWTALRAARDWLDFITEHGTANDVEAAEQQHQEAVRRIIQARDE